MSMERQLVVWSREVVMLLWPENGRSVALGQIVPEGVIDIDILMVDLVDA